MSRPTLTSDDKGRIKRWVLELRRLLEEDLARQMKRLGLEANRPPRPLEQLDYLSEEEREVRRHLDALLKRAVKVEKDAEAAYAAVCREMAYTFLNRLVGLRCMEERGILVVGGEATEVVTTRPEYQGRSRLLRDLRDGGGTKYKYAADAEERLLRDGLRQAFEAVTADIRVLFDPGHEYGRLWPSYAGLKAVVEKINAALPAEFFAAPELLGWVYQFFNVEEKERIRRETKGKPRTPYELAVINQFYTPDWIVKFLVDNTLGRVWVQMHPDTRLHRKPGDPAFRQGVGIDYLVPGTGEDRAQPMRPAGELRLLDPACGTMHFGQYAYALLFEMYREEMERAGSPGWPEKPSAATLAEVPASILENNLFGIDIDARAVQIAALALLLTAREVAAAHGLSPATVRVRRMNLVVADAVNVGEEELTRLLSKVEDGLHSPDLRRMLIGALWDNLKHVARLGSLVQVDEGLEEARQRWVSGQKSRHRDSQGQGVFGGTFLEDEARTLQESLLEALHEYAAKATDASQRLFAEDTVRGFELLNLLSLKYDAVVMNPPYGEFIPEVKKYVGTTYPLTKNDIYAAFIDRGTQLLQPGGNLGAIVSRTFVNLTTFENLRREILLKRNPLVTMLDLGDGVLDGAMVQTAALVVGGDGAEATAEQGGFDSAIAFFRLTDTENKEDRFSDALGESSAEVRYDVPRADLRGINGTTLSYWVKAEVLHLFRELPPLQGGSADARQGLGTADDPRFVRNWWEVEPKTLLPRTLVTPAEYRQQTYEGKRWVTFAKGGAYSRFYGDACLLLKWARDGEEVKEFVITLPGTTHWSRQVRSEACYFFPGLTWSRRTQRGLSVRVMSQGCIFADKGPSIFPQRPEESWYILGILNSVMAEYCCRAMMSFGSYEVGVIQKLPMPSPAADIKAHIATLARQLHDAKAAWDEGNEISTRFKEPWLLPALRRHPDHDLGAALDSLLAAEKQADAQLQAWYADLDTAVFDAYDLSAATREQIIRDLGERPPEIVWPQMEGKSDKLKRVEHVVRLVSFLVKQIVEADPEGIVPLVSVPGRATLEERLHSALVDVVGHEHEGLVYGRIVSELKKGPGWSRLRSLGDYLANHFFKYHAKLYKDRPIFWHLASTSAGDDPAFAALVHYHRFDREALRKLRGFYVRHVLDRLQREQAQARADSKVQEAVELEGQIEEVRAFDAKLRQVEEGEIPIRVRWKTAEEQSRGWDPDLDDGVAVNLLPLQEAGVLRYNEVVSRKAASEEDE